MRAIHNAIEVVESLSPNEELFNRRRHTIGLFLGPVLLGVVLLAPLPIPPQAHRMGAILAMVIVFWITEALPISVTAMLGPVLAVVFGVAPVRQALAPFADPIIFLFIGSFILARAMFVHGLDRRIAFTALSWRLVGSSAGRILIVYGAVAAGLSMWISNTATTAMMLPIGLSILAHLSRSHAGAGRDIRSFGLALMLMTSFAASVGGLATPVGTPPNLLGIGMLERIAGIRVAFFEWVVIGVPAVMLLFAFLVGVFYVTSARGVQLGEIRAELVAAELSRLGALSRGQLNVLVAFGVTIVLWVAPGLFALTGMDDTRFSHTYTQAVPEGVAAMIGAFLLFLLPVDWRGRRFTLTWDEAVQIDWGIMLLYGGGLAMGELAFSTGLAEAIGRGLSSSLASHSTFALTALFTGLAIVLSETTSNIASANMVVPIAIAVSVAAGVRPVEPALGATLGASMGFMMPISTAPNAMVYASGYVPITAMIRYGILLDLVGFGVIVTVVLLLAPLVI